MGGGEIFVARFDASMDLKYGSYLGGTGPDNICAHIHHDINTTIVGNTLSDDFPTTVGSFQRQNEGGIDMFVTRLWTGDPPDATPPTPPRNLTAEVEETRVRLAWEHPADPGGTSLRGYVIYRGVSESNLRDVDRSILGKVYMDSPLADGSTYYYAVSAYNVNEGNLSNIVNVTVYGSPRIPSNIESTPGCNTVTLTWTPPEETGGHPILGYRVYRGTTTTGIGHLDDLDNRTSYTDMDVVNGKTYLYQICAFTEYGDGPKSGTIIARPVGGPSAPYEVETSTGNGTVNIHWTVPLDNPEAFSI